MLDFCTRTIFHDRISGREWSIARRFVALLDTRARCWRRGPLLSSLFLSIRLLNDVLPIVSVFLSSIKVFYLSELVMVPSQILIGSSP